LHGISNFPHNNVKIYNRWGNLVYEADHYVGDWDGYSNGKRVMNNKERLPVGTYYYVIDLGDGHEPFVGYLYLNR
jgi:gliding motility-associated-like protein